jgi:PAS domain-containing protein
MRPKHSVKASSSAMELALDSALGEPYGWLSALFRSSALGVGIFDRQLRFRAINDALAFMHGRPAAANLGKTIQQCSEAPPQRFCPRSSKCLLPVSRYQTLK